MDFLVDDQENIKLVTVVGEIDSKTAPELQEKVISLVESGGKILLNMTEVAYMSSAGLRMLLSLYRQTTAKEGKLVLVGLSEDLQDTMSVTGFLDFFTTRNTVEEGLEALN